MLSQIPKEVLVLLASIGAIQSLFLSVLIGFRKKLGLKDIMLLVLLLSLTLRVAKSGLWYFSESSSLWLLNIGFAAQAAIGPSLLLYILLFLNDSYKPKPWVYSHFLPTCSILIASPFLQLDSFWYLGGYKALCYYSLIYVIVGMSFLVWKMDQKTINIKWKHKVWLVLLTTGSLVLTFAYFANYILRISSYITAPLLYSVASYTISFYGLRHQEVWKIYAQDSNKKTYKKSLVDDSEIAAHLEKLLKSLKENKLYLDSNLTLSQLAKQLTIQPQALSQLINQHFQKNFPEFINSYRIEHAKNLLLHSEFQHKTIASIAFESGFHSLSAFNAAFKKFTGTTPSKYRKQPI